VYGSCRPAPLAAGRRDPVPQPLRAPADRRAVLQGPSGVWRRCPAAAPYGPGGL